MEHEKKKGPVAWSMFVPFTISTVSLSKSDNKETPVVKEEETYDAGDFEKVEAEVVKLLKEPQSLVEESSMSSPG